VRCAPVGRLPHLLELELLDALLIGGDGGALDADVALLDGLGGVNGDLNESVCVSKYFSQENKKSRPHAKLIKIARNLIRFIWVKIFQQYPSVWCMLMNPWPPLR
jgi:hypothetical protein